MDAYIKFHNQTSGKDKIFRLCQYTSRIVWYSLEKQKRYPDAVGKAKHLDEILGLMRQLLRFGRFIDACPGSFPTVSISDSVIRLTSSLSRISNASFLFIDHVICLNKLGLLPPKLINSSKWDVLSTKFWLYSIFLGLIRDFYDILRIYKEEFQVKFRNSKVRDNFNIAGGSSSSSASLGSSSSSRQSAERNHHHVTSGVFPLLNHSNSMVKYVRQIKTVTNCVVDHADVAVDTLKNLCDLFIPLNSLGVVKLSPGFIGFLGVTSTVVSAIPQLNPMIKMVPAS